MKTLLTLFAFSILSINAYAKDMSSSTLDEYIRQRDNSPIEGNISIPSSKWKMNVFRSLIHKNSAIKSIGEIGFNAGHSSENFLLANPTCKVISFDIMTHTYTKIGKKYIDISYPGRHTLIGGDSAITVKKFSARKGHPLFDLIFVDGSHAYIPAYNDIINMRSLAHPKTILVVDDINFSDVSQAWERCLQEGVVKEIKRYTEDTGLVIGEYCFQ